MAGKNAKKLSSKGLESIYGYNLKRAYMVVSGAFRDDPALESISPRLYTTLSLVAENPNTSQSTLAKALGIERSGMVKIVDNLEQRGWLERVPVVDDRRKYALNITPTGRVQLVQFGLAIDAHEDKLLSDFSDDERKQFLSFLHRLSGV